MLMVRWPWGSRSMRRTRLPSSASAHPRFTAVVVLPTPPFWLATAMTLLKRWLDLYAGTWLRLFNGNTAAPSSSVLCGCLQPERRHPPVAHVAPPVDPGRGRHSLGIEGQRRQEFRRSAGLGDRFEARCQFDQGRLAECRSHERDPDRGAEGESHRDIDDGVADDRRRR